MSSSPSSQNASPSSSLSTPAALWRLKPFVKPVIWRLAGGAASALVAAIIALVFKAPYLVVVVAGALAAIVLRASGLAA